MTKASKGSFANIEDTRAALRESIAKTRRLAEQSELLVLKQRNDARRCADGAGSTFK